MLPRLNGRVHARFLPPTCPEHVPTQLDAEGRLVAPQAGQNDWGKRLDFATWLCAWRQYAIGAPSHLGKIVVASLRLSLAGAAVIKQMDFKLAMAHERLVCEVAFTAGRSTMMGVMFDEIVRWIAVLRCACKRLHTRP